jgi:plasmid stabilization system protein ParE
MPFQVRLTETADDQINKIYVWMRNRNAASADRWFRNLMNAISTLQENPRRCPFALEHEIFAEEIRQLLYGKGRNAYRVLYIIQDQTVYVSYVRHTSQALLTSGDLVEE